MKCHLTNSIWQPWYHKKKKNVVIHSTVVKTKKALGLFDTMLPPCCRITFMINFRSDRQQRLPNSPSTASTYSVDCIWPLHGRIRGRTRLWYAGPSSKLTPHHVKIASNARREPRLRLQRWSTSCAKAVTPSNPSTFERPLSVRLTASQ